MLRSLKSRISMKRIGESFYDAVVGDVVNHWGDCFGDEYIAVSRFGMRVKID